jgi:hypothetical protein
LDAAASAVCKYGDRAASFKSRDHRPHRLIDWREDEVRVKRLDRGRQYAMSLLTASVAKRTRHECDFSLREKFWRAGHALLSDAPLFRIGTDQLTILPRAAPVSVKPRTVRRDNPVDGENRVHPDNIP